MTFVRAGSQYLTLRKNLEGVKTVVFGNVYDDYTFIIIIYQKIIW